MSLDRRISLTWVSSFNYSQKYLLRFIILINPTFLKEGDMEVYGSAVLSFFSSGISVILILMCGIAVSSSPAVCGFSSFWLTVFGKRRSFTVLRYCSFGLSCLMQVNIWKTLDLTVNEYTISGSYSMIKLVGHPINWLFNLCTD